MKERVFGFGLNTKYTRNLAILDKNKLFIFVFFSLLLFFKNFMARTSFFKGVKSFLSNKGGSSSDSQAGQGDDIYAREGVAVTLTTEFNNIKKGDITLFSVESGFIPCQVLSSSCFENKAYVHYEPKKAQVALGTNPDAKRHKKSVKLTIEQYAWMIQQLQEEKSVDLILKNNKSPMLGIISMNNGKSIGKRLIRFVQQKRKTFVQQQCIFMLPKALLLQAASYIPMTKPLPPPLTSIQHHILSNQPYQLINDKYKSQLKRYCNLIQLCEHELLLNIQKGQEPTPPCSLNDSIETRCKIKCEDCLINTCNISTIIIQQENKLFPVLKEQSIMFPVSFIQYNNTNNLISNSTPKNKVNTSSAIQPQRRIAFDSIARRQKPHAISAFQYIPPDRSSSSSISSISQYSNIQEEDEEEEEGEEIDVTPQKYGYVAVDDDNEEILIVFPGMATSQNMLENASFVPVPWHEINTAIEKKNSEDASPWVLECALTAWHRCEMKVVTLLMRLCGTMPSHYKVVILGYSLGGGKKITMRST